jgi:hypothetical protein
MEGNTSAQSPKPELVERAKAIVLQPKTEWPRVAGETTEPMKVLTGYAVPLAAIGPVAALIGGQVFGYSVFGVTYRQGLIPALTTAVVSFVLTLVSLFVVALVANFLGPRFGGRDNFPAAFRLVAYSMTAAWVAGIFGLVPALAILSIVGLYSIYLFYLGATPVAGVPQEKAASYTAVTVVVAILAYLIVGAVAAAIVGVGTPAGLTTADRTAIDLGEYGNVTVDGENQTVDLGELGKIEMSGDTATITVDGQEIEVPVDRAMAAAAE